VLREQIINVLETATVVLTLTNAVSIAAAVYAISLARGSIHTDARTASQDILLAFLARRLRRKHGAFQQRSLS
jgi:ActR/RegA family two-component response regulator